MARFGWSAILFPARGYFLWVEYGMGCSRIAFRVGRWAVKIPNFVYGWRAFLRGLLDNMDEAAFWRWPISPTHPLQARWFCPIVFQWPGGWFVVMPWCTLAGQTEHGIPEEDVGLNCGELLKGDNVGWYEEEQRWIDYADA